MPKISPQKLPVASALKQAYFEQELRRTVMAYHWTLLRSFHAAMKRRQRRGPSATNGETLHSVGGPTSSGTGRAITTA